MSPRAPDSLVAGEEGGESRKSKGAKSTSSQTRAFPEETERNKGPNSSDQTRNLGRRRARGSRREEEWREGLNEEWSEEQRKRSDEEQREEGSEQSEDKTQEMENRESRKRMADPKDDQSNMLVQTYEGPKNDQG